VSAQGVGDMSKSSRGSGGFGWVAVVTVPSDQERQIEGANDDREVVEWIEGFRWPIISLPLQNWHHRHLSSPWDAVPSRCERIVPMPSI
jgi:hypothetical protein